jgi:hypothetical protein
MLRRTVGLIYIIMDFLSGGVSALKAAKTTLRGFNAALVAAGIGVILIAFGLSFFSFQQNAIKIKHRFSPEMDGDITSVAHMESLRNHQLRVTVTTEEINKWKERATNGPYKTKHDVSINSPGDWDRIVVAKNTFLSNPSAQRYVPYPGVDNCLPASDDSQVPWRNGEEILQAAFYYLITEDEVVANAVKNELLAQANTPEVDFTNRTRWCNSLWNQISFPPHFAIPEWLSKLLITYDYVRPSMSIVERETMDLWFYNSADCLDRFNELDIKNFYIDGIRPSEPATPPNFKSAMYEYYGNKTTHYGGWDVKNGNKQWSNRRWKHIRYIGQVGVFLSSVEVTHQAINLSRINEFKENSKLGFKEWLTYCVYEDGTLGEHYRWGESAGSRDQGLAYSAMVLASALELADIFARSGDKSLYKYTTSGGFSASVGGPKNLLKTLQNYCKYMDGQWERYATSFPENVGNLMYKIDGVRLDRPGGVTYMVNEIWFSKANLYYKDDYIKQVYTRSAEGTQIYPANPESVFAWMGGNGTQPASLFMYGQMENHVWPY